MFHHHTVEQHIELFRSGPVIFQCAMLVLSHLYDDSQKYVDFLKLYFLISAILVNFRI